VLAGSHSTAFNFQLLFFIKIEFKSHPLTDFGALVFRSVKITRLLPSNCLSHTCHNIGPSWQVSTRFNSWYKPQRYRLPM